MKVLIKILGLIGLINCIVLYGADYKKDDSVAVPISGLQVGRSRTHVGSATGIGTGLYDPSSQVREASQERRSSSENLMSYFSKQYDEMPRSPESSVEKLISKFKDLDNARFARECFKQRSPELQQLNDAVTESPVHRSRRLSTGDGQTDFGDRPTPREDKQAIVIEVMICMMKKELELKEKIHQEKAAAAKKQFEEGGKQTERIARKANCLTLTSIVAGLGNVAWAIYVGTSK